MGYIYDVEVGMDVNERRLDTLRWRISRKTYSDHEWDAENDHYEMRLSKIIVCSWGMNEFTYLGNKIAGHRVQLV